MSTNNGEEMMNNMSLPDSMIFSAAVHAAGHATMALLQGRMFETVSIEPATCVCVGWPEPSILRANNYALTPRTRPLANDYVTQLASGVVAERRFAVNRQDVDLSDEPATREWVLRLLNGDETDLGQVLRRTGAAAAGRMRWHDPGLRGLADVLVAEYSLSYSRAFAVFRAADNAAAAKDERRAKAESSVLRKSHSRDSPSGNSFQERQLVSHRKHSSD